MLLDRVSSIDSIAGSTSHRLEVPFLEKSSMAALKTSKMYSVIIYKYTQSDRVEMYLKDLTEII